nr:MAG TPA: hypothetical protein [Caudoviricetes sp.]
MPSPILLRLTHNSTTTSRVRLYTLKCPSTMDGVGTILIRS